MSFKTRILAPVCLYLGGSDKLLKKHRLNEYGYNILQLQASHFVEQRIRTFRGGRSISSYNFGLLMRFADSYHY